MRFADEAHARQLARLLASGLAPVTTSAGRYFDAVAALLGISQRVTYEGEAAMRLEALADDPIVDDSGWHLTSGVLGLDPLLQRIADCDDAQFAARLFHGTFAAALAAWAKAASAESGLQTVALGGGCFLNRILTEQVTAGLRAEGIDVLLPRHLPVNDGGLSYGQAAVAAMAMQAGDEV